ncbi:hypothetical protein AOLI_G00325590 [Acnodon oligacanthus]
MIITREQRSPLVAAALSTSGCAQRQQRLVELMESCVSCSRHTPEAAPAAPSASRCGRGSRKRRRAPCQPSRSALRVTPLARREGRPPPHRLRGCRGAGHRLRPPQAQRPMRALIFFVIKWVRDPPAPPALNAAAAPLPLHAKTERTPKPRVDAACAAAGGGGNAAEAGCAAAYSEAPRHTLPPGCGGGGGGGGAGAGLGHCGRAALTSAARPERDCLRTEKSRRDGLPQDRARPDRLQHQALSTSRGRFLSAAPPRR